jgi:DNA-binding transcriptional regulator YdaS (Cro superfamily)
MEVVRQYLNSLTPAKQIRFAKRCGTSIGYLRKAISKNHRLGAKLVISMERESDGALTCEQIQSDTDWAFLRGTRKAG